MSLDPPVGGMAGHCLAAELAQFLKVEVPPPQHHSAVEYNASCQQELRHGPSNPLHLFADVNDFWKPAVKETLEKIQADGLPLNRNTLLPLIQSGKAVKRTAFCQVHQRECELEGCREGWMGFPCVSWSPQGQQSKDNGLDFMAFAAFAALTLEVED